MSLNTWTQPSKAGEEESRFWVEWVETGVRNDVSQNDSRKSERGHLKDSSETCYDVLFGDGSTDK